MRARDGRDLAPAQHVLGEPLRARHVRHAAVQQPLDERLAARHDVADDDDVGLQVELRGIVAVDQLDALGRKLRAHRRVDVGVGAGHAMPRGARERREAAHEGSAYAEDVQVHQDGAPKKARDRACAANHQVTAIANPVTRPVSSAERRMWPTIRRYHTTTSTEPAVAKSATA